MILRFFILIILIFNVIQSVSARQTRFSSTDRNSQKIFKQAQVEINKGSYDTALKLLINYRKLTSKNKIQPLTAFFVIEYIGRIYLRVKQDPDAAIKFFAEALNDKNLSDSEFDIIRAWLGRAYEWKNLGMLPKDIKDPSKLFELGKKYYEQGITSQKYTMDISASADFSLASNYIIPFTIYFDKDSNIGEALYIMGEIRRRSWHNNYYWTDNFYLMEVIRRFPNSELATRAYKALYEDVHFGYTGSSGDNTPESWIELLKEFKELSKILTQAPNPIIKIN